MDKRQVVETYFQDVFDSFDSDAVKFAIFIFSLFSIRNPGKDPVNHVETKAQDPKVSRLILV